MPSTALLLPDVHRQPVAGPAVAAVVRRLRRRLLLRAAGRPAARVSLRSVGRAIVTFAIAALIMVTSFRRSRLGVSGPLGESMFVDLRDRISRQGNLPPLPPEWLGGVGGEARPAARRSRATSSSRAARSTTSSTSCVVDVSGKGVEAGSRSLFLSGAFNGIVSALPGEQFLPAANDYLMGQDWDEGFATAIHLHLDLGTGDFELRKAGHPPAVWLHAGSGRWTVRDLRRSRARADGRRRVRVRPAGGSPPGDGLMLFTDGLVETADPRHRPRHRQARRPGGAAAAARIRRRAPSVLSTRSRTPTTTGRSSWCTGAG